MDEYISREAVVRYLKGYSEKELNSRGNFGMITSSVLDKAERAISEMPTAHVQPVKHGRWEEKHYMEMKWIPSRFDDVSPEDVDIEPMVELKCSKCHLWSVNFRNHIELKYCPNCGARMDGES